MAGKFIIKTGDKGFHFVLTAGNGEIIATSQVYKTKESCRKGIESVRANAPEAPVVEEEPKE
ncbi:MAG: YegP family protein [Atopobiaceae bacterium]|nr:YegP family protein [Atopobiaceae bacterium]